MFDKAVSHVAEGAEWLTQVGSLEEVVFCWGKTGLSVSALPHQDPAQHQALLATAFLTLAVFVAIYVLVYAECLVRRWLRAVALLTWACLMTLGYVLVFDSRTKEACAWEQVTGWGSLVYLGPGYCQPAAPLWASGPSWSCVLYTLGLHGRHRLWLGVLAWDLDCSPVHFPC